MRVEMIVRRRALSANTMRAYRSRLNQWSRWCEINKTPPHIVSRRKTLAWLNDRARRGVKKATIQAGLSVLSQIVKDAGGELRLAERDLAAVWRAVKRRRGLVVNQAKPFRFEHWVRANARGADTRALCIAGISVFAMARVSEIIALNIGDFDPATRSLRLLRTKTHGASKHVVDIPAELSGRLEEYLGKRHGAKGHRALFTNRAGTRIIYAAVIAAIREVALRGGADNWRAMTGHSGRVGGACCLFEMGYREDDIRKKGGWANIAMVSRYARAAETTITYDKPLGEWLATRGDA